MESAARVASYLLHPIFMPLAGLWLALNSDSYLNLMTTDDVRWRIYLLFGIHTIILPLISLWIMKRARMISSFELDIREERTAPYFATLFYIGMAYYMFQSSAFPDILLAMLMGMIVLLALALLINTRFKISMHTIGAGALAGGWLALSQVLEFNGLKVMTILVLILGIVATSRLVLKAHKGLEVYAGAVLGFLVQYLVMRNEWVI